MKFNILKKIGLSHLLIIFLTLSGSIAAFEVEGDKPFIDLKGKI